MTVPERNPPGILLVLSAPSGAGKTTLAQRLIRDLPDAHSSVSVTTRPPRGHERDGVDYHFVDVLTFKKQIEQGDFAEWAEVHGNFYGSLQTSVESARSKKEMAVFDIDVQGGLALRKKHPDAVTVFILPPSMAELERRLRDRKTDTEETIHRRMLAARSEIEKGYATYDFIIVNDDVERAYQQLKAVVMAERCRRGRVEVPDIAGMIQSE